MNWSFLWVELEIQSSSFSTKHLSVDLKIWPAHCSGWMAVIHVERWVSVHHFIIPNSIAGWWHHCFGKRLYTIVYLCMLPSCVWGLCCVFQIWTDSTNHPWKWRKYQCDPLRIIECRTWLATTLLQTKHSQNMITTYLCLLFEYVLSQNIGTQNPMAFLLHPGRLTWNLHITHLERKMIFQTSMIMFHVNLQGCKMNHFQDNFGIPKKIHVIIWRLSTSAHSPPWPWPNGGPTLITFCYNPYKRPYKWVTEVTTPINGVITYNW